MSDDELSDPTTIEALTRRVARLEFKIDAILNRLMRINGERRSPRENDDHD